MHYTSLQLKNFRSYKDLSVELSEGVNIVVGPNASGKTNMLEAILVASKGSSFRANDRALISYKEEALKIVAITNESHERTVLIKKFGEEKTTKEFKINNVVQKRLLGSKIIPTTLFEPEHLRMVHGSPEGRREYLDGILGVIEPGYKTTLNKYRKALAQRNRLLKSDHFVSADDVFVWDVQLSEYGGAIHSSRVSLAHRINDVSNEIYTSVSGEKSDLSVIYGADAPEVDGYSSTMLKVYQERFDVDRTRGFTTRGPHRDDLQFILNDTPANISASRGETRTIVLTCKILEMKILEEFLGRKPIILLDDVFSELDGARRMALTDYLKSHQTVITTTDADAIVKSFLDGYNVIATG